MDIPRPDNFNETYLYEGMLVIIPTMSTILTYFLLLRVDGV